MEVESEAVTDGSVCGRKSVPERTSVLNVEVGAQSEATNEELSLFSFEA
jgi:hypothetical protein